MTKNTNRTSIAGLIAWAALKGAAEVAAWALSLRRQVLTVPLSDDECEAAGKALGSRARAVFVGPLEGARWWSFDACDDGEGCFHLRGLRMAAEVHFVTAPARAL